MKIIQHSLKFVTELDENDPTAQRLLSLPEADQIFMLESMLKEILLPKIQPTLDEVNAGGSWAILKAVK
jgi:hypothetical protein